MSKPHPLADEIKKWANDPEAWQWQFYSSPGTFGAWVDCNFDSAMDVHGKALCEDRSGVRLIPKRSMIPADRLPEGWAVERSPDGVYLWRDETGPSGRAFPETPFWKLLHHIDPEAK